MHFCLLPFLNIIITLSRRDIVVIFEGKEYTVKLVFNSYNSDKERRNGSIRQWITYLRLVDQDRQFWLVMIHVLLLTEDNSLENININIVKT